MDYVEILKRHLAPILAPPPGELAQVTAKNMVALDMIVGTAVPHAAAMIERALQAAREEEREGANELLHAIRSAVDARSENVLVDIVRLVDARDRLSRKVEELKGAIRAFNRTEDGCFCFTGNTPQGHADFCLLATKALSEPKP